MTIRMKHCLLLASLFLTAASGAAEPPTEKLVLKNDRAELVFSGGKTFLFESYRSEGAEMLPAGGSATHPWRLVYRGVNGENPNLLPRNGYYDGGERLDTLGMAALRVTWRVHLDGGPARAVRVTVALGADSELPEWRLDADLPEGWVLTEAEFPRIAVARPRDAKGILPVGAFGLTEICADDWSYIEKTYGPHMELFRNGLIFAQARKADALDAADERAELRHGLEPVDVESGRKDAKTTPFDGKGV